ncbi:MAG: hypothetical protein WC774_01185, partial [Candidatus Gracilibacteria bacterium]
PGSAIARFLRASEDGKNFLIIHIQANAREAGVRTVPGADRIIEAGFCLLDSKFNFMESGEITVNPNPDIITSYASALTGIPERKSKRGYYFPGAYDMFLEMYDSKNTILCSYGSNHLAHFAHEMELFGLEPPDEYGRWLRNALDIESGVASAVGVEDTLSIEDAMELLDLDPVGHFHNAGTDALHISMILSDVFESSVS